MSAHAAKWYVTFSGESSAPINNVYALDASGATVQTAVLAKLPRKLTLSELRGMAFGPDGTLYVANSHRSSSQILSFSKDVDSKGRRHFIGVVADPSLCKGLMHPYALAFLDSTLFVSSQDTGVVSSFSAPPGGGRATPDRKSSYLRTSFPKGGFLEATFVACSNHPDKPKDGGGAIPASRGGLAYSTIGKKSHSVRGLELGTNPAVLYVCDEAETGNRIAMYDPAKGTYLGQIAGKHLDGPVDVAIDPTNGSLAIASAGNRSLFSATPPSNFPARPITVKPALVTSDKVLDGVSGLAYDHDGTLYLNARKACQVWTWNGTALAEFSTTFTDTPELLLRVP